MITRLFVVEVEEEAAVNDNVSKLTVTPIVSAVLMTKVAVVKVVK
ncbi:hypothetical protein [Paenibacillus sp. LjRoot56]